MNYHATVLAGAGTFLRGRFEHCSALGAILLGLTHLVIEDVDAGIFSQYYTSKV